MNHISRINRIAALLISAVMLTACAKRGRVIDYDTKQPIEGAMVIGYWVGQKFNPVIAQSGCIGPEVVTTDRDGMFTYPKQREWFGLIPGNTMQIAWIYKPGHVYYDHSKHYNAQAELTYQDKSRPWEWVMKKDDGTADIMIGFERQVDENSMERQGLRGQRRDFGCQLNNQYRDAKRQGMCKMFQDIGEELYSRGKTREHFSEAYTNKGRARRCQLEAKQELDMPDLQAEYEAKIKGLPK
jgi:hypothetical protein